MIQILDWLALNWAELAATVLALIGIFLQIKQNPWYWMVSIFMVVLYIYVFYISGFYADMSFQVYYLVISVYGWYYWVTGKVKKEKGEIQTSKLKPVQWLYSLIFASVIFVFIYFLLTKFTNSQVPLGDAFTTSLSFIATWLLARKIIDNWIIWIVVNVVSTSLYIHKELYMTAFVFTVLTIMAFVGYFKWKKALANA